MEQKQLDDLEDSFFGEEFIEELEDLPPAPTKSQEIKIEPRAEPAELRLHKAKKMPALKKSAVKKTEKSTPVKVKETVSEEKPTLSEKVSEAKELKEQKEKKASVHEAKKETAAVHIKPAKESFKESVKETKPVVETTSPVNPWEDDDKGPSMFKEASTWKALTGVALVLLMLSLFTQGFNFGENSVTGGTVSLQEAEDKALSYVNSQLLQPPFQAELESSQELDTLYQITLSVAGQMVDSYVTKDGKLFFPQGLELDKTAPGNEDSGLSGSEETVDDRSDLEDAASGETEPETTEPELAPEEPQEVEDPVVAESVKVTLNAKKWVFSPSEVAVKKGSKVVLTVIPSGLDFTFAVPALGVEKKVAGPTEVEFVADKAGTFDFTCGSCEDWRGMKGTLLVE